MDSPTPEEHDEVGSGWDDQQPRRRSRPPSRAAIVAAQREVIERAPNVEFLYEECWPVTCWACGLDRRLPQRAHIVPASAGGSDEPDNFLLLCRRCHYDQPDAQPLEVQMAWLRTRPNWLHWLMSHAPPVLAAVADLADEHGLTSEELWEAKDDQGQKTSWREELSQMMAELPLASVRDSNTLANYVWSVYARALHIVQALPDRQSQP